MYFFPATAAWKFPVALKLQNFFNNPLFDETADEEFFKKRETNEFLDLTKRWIYFQGYRINFEQTRLDMFDAVGHYNKTISLRLWESYKYIFLFIIVHDQ